MNIETKRLLLRAFTLEDLDAIYTIFSDPTVNTFLPWFCLKSHEEAQKFYVDHYENPNILAYAVCLKENNLPIGYIHVSKKESHDFGYGLLPSYWHQGIITEAGQAVLKKLKQDGWSFVTATHDIKNPASGKVMQRLGMTYHYSYQEQWQPKNIPVVFRLYQLNLDDKNDRVYTAYQQKYPFFIEENV